MGKVCEIMSFQAQAKNLTLEFYVEKEMSSEVTTDRKRYLQILFNLLSNAFKYTKKGYVKVLVCRRNNLLVTDVVDSGVGMS